MHVNLTKWTFSSDLSLPESCRHFHLLCLLVTTLPVEEFVVQIGLKMLVHIHHSVLVMGSTFAACDIQTSVTKTAASHNLLSHSRPHLSLSISSSRKQLHDRVVASLRRPRQRSLIMRVLLRDVDLSSTEKQLSHCLVAVSRRLRQRGPIVSVLRDEVNLFSIEKQLHDRLVAIPCCRQQSGPLVHEHMRRSNRG